MVVNLSEVSGNVNLTLHDIQKVIGDFDRVFPKNVSLDNIVTAVTELMKIVGKIKKLKGEEKKYIVTKVLLYIIETNNMGKYDDIFDSVLSGIIPTMIDTFIDVEKGNLVFNDKYCKCNESCFPSFF